jgi:hypothetical protein
MYYSPKVLKHDIHNCYRGRIGCAFYDSVTCVVYVLEDTEESPHFDFTMMRLGLFHSFSEHASLPSLRSLGTV